MRTEFFGLSDAVTVSLYSSTVAFTGPVQVKESHYGMAALAFLVKSFGGLLIGIFFGLLSALATRTTQHHRSKSLTAAPNIKKKLKHCACADG
jgi:NhaP-type Na+/H+ or K+/H+ antiporter